MTLASLAILIAALIAGVLIAASVIDVARWLKARARIRRRLSEISKD